MSVKPRGVTPLIEWVGNFLRGVRLFILSIFRVVINASLCNCSVQVSLTECWNFRSKELSLPGTKVP